MCDCISFVRRGRAVGSTIGHTRRTLDELASVLPSAWSAASSWIDEWDARNPARGQCGSTALVVQDLCGGHLMAGEVRERSDRLVVHYWNFIDRRRVDFTWHQFESAAQVVQCTRVSRDQLLTSAWFTQRYSTLREGVDALWQQRIAIAGAAQTHPGWR